jgi:hypothetical protein
MVSLVCILLVCVFRLPFVESADSGAREAKLPPREKPLALTTTTTGATNTTSIPTSMSNTTSKTNNLVSFNMPKICNAETPTPEVWKAHNISAYLASYANGKNVTISVIYPIKDINFFS